jgi:hypothetical protein
VAKLWQKYRVRSGLIGSFPASESSVSDGERTDEVRSGPIVSRASEFSNLATSATTLLPGQDKPSPSAPTLPESRSVVSCGDTLLVVVLTGFRKPQVARLGHQSNPLNFKAEEGTQRRLDPLPSTKIFTQDKYLITS